MKFIDEKGRLFGKINVIDFLVLFFLFCLVPMVYFGYKIFTKPAPVVEKRADRKLIDVEIAVSFIKLNPDIASLILAGDKELDSDGSVTAEIIKVSKMEPYFYEFALDNDRQRVLIKDDTLKKINTEVKLKAEVRPDGLYYKNEKIADKQVFNFKTSKYGAEFIRQENLEERELYFNVVFKDLSEDAIADIAVGDKEADNTGRNIAEIIKLGKIENSQIGINMGGVNYVAGEDEHKKQLAAKMKFLCNLRASKYVYFKDRLMNFDIPFQFKTDKYNLNGFLLNNYSEEKWIRLRVKFSGLVSDVASVIQKGDTERIVNGQAVAMIEKIISNKPAEVLSLNNGVFIALSHPFNMDIEASLNVLCVEKDGAYYFKNYPVKIGNSINFSPEFYSVVGIIVRVGE
ncbi:MAG: DUF4330 family protein [Candidatus Omnitrophota bacterium]|nr:DUF4330 family protein [Candidatus Omnitrophota bacterium]